MSTFPIFLTVVYTMRNQADQLSEIIRQATEKLQLMVSDYELVIIDNASTDESVGILKRLAGQSGYPNLQVYALTKEVDGDTASCLGVENALGDFVAVHDPLVDDIGFLPEMLHEAVSGADVVFASNKHKPRQSFAYSIASVCFSTIYRLFSGVHLLREAPQYRLLSKRLVNFILQHPQPSIAYRHLPVTGGFARVNVSYSSTPLSNGVKKLGESIDRGMKLLVSTTQAPMRIVTTLSLFGATANFVYSLYVITVAVLKVDVAPGWVSISLQQSGMFFLISLVLMVLGEYILHMVSLSNEGPPCHVGQEFTSVRLTRREKLNVEDTWSSKEYAPEKIEPVRL